MNISSHHYHIKDHLGNVRETYIHPEANYKECVERTQYYPSGLPWVERQSDGFTEQPWKYNSKEFVEMHGLDEYDSKARWYYPAICRTTTMDPLAEKYYSTSPYAWCGNNPINAIDPDGRDSIYVHDQSKRPSDCGIAGETYTATVVVVQNGDIVGEYRGSSYPNSTSNSDNSTPYNTINEGDYPFNNKYGHKQGTEKGLNIINNNGKRTVPGTNKNGEEVTIEYGNVHSGKSDKGNYNSRGSKACITIHPDDADAFFSHFTWTNDKKTTGNSQGRIFINRDKETKGKRDEN